MGKFPGVVYIDSPIRAAAKQMVPFFHQGVFDGETTPLYMRKRIGNGYGVGQPASFRGVQVTMVGPQVAKNLPVRKGGAVFYGFNSQGNLHTVANRNYRHVLVLHGESNKRASSRPAARLYDHVCLAGEMAFERYLRSGIFSEHDLETGRLIKVGDTFIQDLDGYKIDTCKGNTLLYAPTWEGYGGEVNNYSSLDIGGMEMAERAAQELGLRFMVVRPHPYLGLLKPSLLSAFIRGLLDVARRREVHVDLRDANILTRNAVYVASSVNSLIRPVLPDTPLALCLSDVSAIEAVCLKAGLPNFILLKNFASRGGMDIHAMVRPFYHLKAASSRHEMLEKLHDYYRDARSVDERQRQVMFSVSHSDFTSRNGETRLKRLMDMTS